MIQSKKTIVIITIFLMLLTLISCSKQETQNYSTPTPLCTPNKSGSFLINNTVNTKYIGTSLIGGKYVKSYAVLCLTPEATIVPYSPIIYTGYPQIAAEAIVGWIDSYEWKGSDLTYSFYA